MWPLRGDKPYEEATPKKNKSLMSFLALLDLEWSVRISSNALATLHTRPKTATELLPITSDLVKLSNYLDENIKEIISNEHITPEMWVKLASMTLSRVILFNKRRSGEAAKMTVEQYRLRPAWNNSGSEEMKNSLSDFEKTLASKLTIVQIMGKRGRIVPVILTNDLKECIDRLITTREACGISTSNPHIFAIPKTTSSHMRGEMVQ